MAKEIKKVEGMLDWCKSLGVRPLPLWSTNNRRKDDGSWFGGKAPMGDRWGSAVHTAEDFLYKPIRNKGKEWYKQGEMRCVGFQLGPASGGLVDIDLDCDAAVERAGEFFGDLSPVQYGRGGVRTHMLLRVTQPPDDIAAKYTGMVAGAEGEETGIELRTGYGKTKKGDPTQLQSMVIGRHPDTGEELEFIGEPPMRFEDFPQVPFSEILKRFAALCDAIAARKVWVKPVKSKLDYTRREWQDDGLVERIREALPPMSQMCAEYARDVVPASGNQQCPFCQNGGNPVLSVDDKAGTAVCFWDGCRSLSIGNSRGFDVFHLVAEMEGHLDFVDTLKFLGDRVGIEVKKFTKKTNKNVSKKSAEEKKQAEDLKRRKKEMAAETTAQEYLFLHGNLYATFDGKSWLRVDPHDTKMRLRKVYDEQNKEYVSPYLMSELYGLCLEYATPPADAPDVCPPDRHGFSVNIKTGELLDGIAFRDVVLFVDDSGQTRTEPRSLEQLYVDAVPHEYPTVMSETPVWDSFLDEFARGAVGDDEYERVLLIDCIYTMIGCALADNRLEKMWMLYGKGGSGKGVISRVIRAIVGNDNWYATTLQSLRSRFEVANMRARKVVSLPELQYRPWRSDEEYNLAMDALKRITGRDAVGIEEKHVQFVRDVELSVNVIAASNSLTVFPRDGEESTAWGRRLVVIPTPLPVSKPDPSLAQKIISTELDGIIYKAVWQFCNVLASGGEIPLPKKSERLIADATQGRWAKFPELFELAEDNNIFNPEFRAIVADYLDIDNLEVKTGQIRAAKEVLRDVLGAQILEKPVWNSARQKSERGVGGVRLVAKTAGDSDLDDEVSIPF